MFRVSKCRENEGAQADAAPEAGDHSVIKNGLWNNYE